MGDILLIDDHSTPSVDNLIKEKFAILPDNLQVIRPKEKVFSGGARNLGIEKAISLGFIPFVYSESLKILLAITLTYVAIKK